MGETRAPGPVEKPQPYERAAELEWFVVIGFALFFNGFLFTTRKDIEEADIPLRIRKPTLYP